MDFLGDTLLSLDLHPLLIYLQIQTGCPLAFGHDGMDCIPWPWIYVHGPRLFALSRYGFVGFPVRKMGKGFFDQGIGCQ